MLTRKERPRAIRTLRGWAILVLQEAGAIHDCEEHGWAKDRADPQAREHALEIARQEPPDGLSPHQAVSEVSEVLDSRRCMEGGGAAPRSAASAERGRQFARYKISTASGGAFARSRKRERYSSGPIAWWPGAIKTARSMSATPQIG